VVLLLDRLEDFCKGLFFGVTEILLLVLGIYGDEVYGVRSGETLRAAVRFRSFVRCAKFLAFPEWKSQYTCGMNAHRTQIPIAALLLVTAASCNRSLSSPYVAVLEQGLENYRCLLYYPRGQVRIMSGLSSQMEQEDWERLIFRADYLSMLQYAQREGLLNLTERRQSTLESIGSMGARFFTVAPTEKLLQMQDAKRSSPKRIAVRVATIKVLQILKDEEYKFPGRSGAAGDEFRLVLGTFSETQTRQGKILVPRPPGIPESVELKFRAILQFNPFANVYTYVTADVGTPQQPGWATTNVQ
jgi:hypothetical protein